MLPISFVLTVDGQTAAASPCQDGWAVTAGIATPTFVRDELSAAEKKTVKDEKRQRHGDDSTGTSGGGSGGTKK